MALTYRSPSGVCGKAVHAKPPLAEISQAAFAGNPMSPAWSMASELTVLSGSPSETIRKSVGDSVRSQTAFVQTAGTADSPNPKVTRTILS